VTPKKFCLLDRVVTNRPVTPVPEDSFHKTALQCGTQIENPESLALGALARIAESALSLSESERFRIALVIDAPEPLTWSNHLAGRYPMSGIRKFDRARFA
jgi:hypothetical protein